MTTTEATAGIQAYTPTMDAPLAGHVLHAVIKVDATTYKGVTNYSRYIDVSIECLRPAGDPDCANEVGECEVGDFLVEGEADVDTYRGPAPTQLRDGPIVAWREADPNSVDRPDWSPYLWVWRYA